MEGAAEEVPAPGCSPFSGPLSASALPCPTPPPPLPGTSEPHGPKMAVPQLPPLPPAAGKSGRAGRVWYPALRRQVPTACARVRDRAAKCLGRRAEPEGRQGCTDYNLGGWITDGAPAECESRGCIPGPRRAGESLPGDAESGFGKEPSSRVVNRDPAAERSVHEPPGIPPGDSEGWACRGQRPHLDLEEVAIRGRRPRPAKRRPAKRRPTEGGTAGWRKETGERDWPSEASRAGGGGPKGICSWRAGTLPGAIRGQARLGPRCCPPSLDGIHRCRAPGTEASWAGVTTRCSASPGRAHCIRYSCRCQSEHTA
ncbi:PREDICTED: translation initiation factor IF-2-like [Chinchilla lanigera]|uniref:translation initiation factor IF-2-like n=1 Tax=Chinchilla lanigera TaxID=34839 RepID=UPI0006981C69|nr:PREDICTED: translation initiation factor IF-2-like [Chinchilla lanigera]